MIHRKLSAAWAALFSSLLIVTMLFVTPASFAQGNCKHHTSLQYDVNMPIYTWTPGGRPKGIVIALHGLIMHGSSFEGLGNSLSSQGFLVYATDMRGYGRLTKGYPHEFCGKTDCKQKMNYEKSTQDLIVLTDRLKQQYPSLPLYLVGESLGADLAIRIVSARPEIVDGLVLSSPALRANNFIEPRTIANIGVAATNVHRQLDLTHYMKSYASDDPNVVSEMLADPLVRRTLSTYELFRSYKAVNQTLTFVPQISADKPVLVMQGTEDRCVRPDAVPKLMARLRSHDQQLRWFEKRGHILIETAYIKPDTMSTLVGWLNEHAGELQPQLQASNIDEIIVSDAFNNGAVARTSD